MCPVVSLITTLSEPILAMARSCYSSVKNANAKDVYDYNYETQPFSNYHKYDSYSDQKNRHTA